METRSFFFNRSNFLRSGWRFFVFAFGFLFVGLVFGTATVAVLGSISVETAPGTAAFFLVTSAFSLAVTLVVGWLCGRYLEGLPFRALGAAFTGGWLKNLAAGLILGGLTLALAAALGILHGGLSFHINTEADKTSIASTLITSLAIFAVAAAFEEALFRGYILQTFSRSGLLWFGVLLTSALFATVHNGNPGAAILSWLNTFLAGIWFAAAFIKTRDLWLAFGLHLAWNWTQGSIFGVEVSGLTTIVKSPLMRETEAGPAWITGGDYGIEGGIITTIAIITSTAVIYFLPILKPSEEMLALSEPPAVAGG